MNTQITVNQVLNSKLILERFKGLPFVNIIQETTNILSDHLQLLSTHKICYQLILKRTIKKYAILKDKNVLVVYI